MSANLETEFGPQTLGIIPGVSLSQSVIGGLTFFIDILISFSSGLFIYWIYVINAPGHTGLYLTAITLYTLLMVQSFYMTGLYRFCSILTPYRQIAVITAICTVLFLILTT
jgi:hypothetical protein